MASRYDRSTGGWSQYIKLPGSRSAGEVPYKVDLPAPIAAGRHLRELYPFLHDRQDSGSVNEALLESVRQKSAHGIEVKRRRMLAMGNGGSSRDAAHFVALGVPTTAWWASPPAATGLGAGDHPDPRAESLPGLRPGSENERHSVAMRM